MATFGGANIVTDNLVLWLDAANRRSYPGSGATWTDMSGNNNSGSLVNGPTFSSANQGSIIFDGVDDYVTLGANKYKYQDNFTLESFFYTRQIPNNPGGVCGARYPIVYNHDYGYNLLVGSTGLVFWQIYNTFENSAGVSSRQLAVGNWIHVSVYKSGTTIGMYVNGVLNGTNTLSTNAVYYENDPFTIGGFGRCGPTFFYSKANISTVTLYNRALSPSEVQQNYDALKSRYLNQY